MDESCLLAHSASELLAISSFSEGALSSYGRDVDLIAASYLVRLVSQTTDKDSGFSCTRPINSGNPSLLQERVRQPSIKSTLITAPQSIACSLHNLSTNHDPEAKYIAPYLSTARHAIIAIDLACVADIDQPTKQNKIITTIELFKSVARGWSGCRPSHLDIFLAFTNVEHLEHQLASTEQKLDPDSYLGFESDSHRFTPSTLNDTAYSAIYRLLKSLFADVQTGEVAALPSPSNTDPFQHPGTQIELSPLTPACRATLHDILSRFVRGHDTHAAKIYPCLVDIRDNAALRRFWSLVNEVVISESLIVMSCFCTVLPSADDYGPKPGHFSF